MSASGDYRLMRGDTHLGTLRDVEWAMFWCDARWEPEPAFAPLKADFDEEAAAGEAEDWETADRLQTYFLEMELRLVPVDGVGDTLRWFMLHIEGDRAGFRPWIGDSNPLDYEPEPDPDQVYHLNHGAKHLGTITDLLKDMHWTHAAFTPGAAWPEYRDAFAADFAAMNADEDATVEQYQAYFRSLNLKLDRPVKIGNEARPIVDEIHIGEGEAMYIVRPLEW